MHPNQLTKPLAPHQAITKGVLTRHARLMGGRLGSPSIPSSDTCSFFTRRNTRPPIPQLMARPGARRDIGPTRCGLADSAIRQRIDRACRGFDEWEACIRALKIGGPIEV